VMLAAIHAKAMLLYDTARRRVSGDIGRHRHEVHAAEMTRPASVCSIWMHAYVCMLL
jgi:hypothetical protein